LVRNRRADADRRSFLQEESMSSELIELTPSPSNDVHQTVQEYYGARARTRTSCCGPADCCSPVATDLNDATIALYTPDQLGDLPEEVASFSLGCGNPTAIASLEPGNVVVDLGSGGGLDAFLAARQVGPTGYVYGVDMTDDMLALARANAAKMGIANVEFRKGQIEALPLDDGTVDVIISNCVINLSPDKGQTLGEAARVLRAGGRLAVSDVVVDGSLDDLPVSEAQVRQALSWAGCVAGALTVADYRHFLAEAGFGQIKVEISHHYRRADLGIADDEVVAGMTPEVVDRLVGRFASAYITAVKP
jgi:arsenite methyltransferase